MTPKELIIRKCEELCALLIDKNEKYGNSALSPMRVFSHVNQQEQLLVRMDDKLSRIKNQSCTDDEDPYLDLAGYLILYMISREQK